MNMVEHSAPHRNLVRMPRVVQLGLWLVPASGGTFKSVRQFSKALHGVVHSCTFRESLASLTDDERQSLYCNHLIIGSSALERMYSVPAAGELKRLNKDVADAELVLSHCFWRWGAYAIWRFHKKSGVPYWVIPHGGLDPYVWSYHWLIKKIWFELYGRRILRDAQLVICSTRREREKVLSIEPRSKCVVVRWPIETVPDIAASKDEIRRHSDLPVNKRILLYLGRLHPMKRIPELIEIFCRAGVKGTQLVIVGPGDNAHVAAVHAAKRAFDVEGCVAIRPPVYGNEKFRLLKAADGFVSNSARENFGLAAAEAMASGIPVILSNGNDLVYEIEDSGVGWLLRETGPAAMINAIRQFDGNAVEDLQIKGRSAQQWVRDNLSFEKFEAKLRSLASESLR